MGWFNFLNPKKEEKSQWERYLRSLFVWNPLIILGFCLALGNLENFSRHYLISLMIASIVSSFCFGGDALFFALEKHWLHSRGLPERKHTRTYHMTLACIFMPPGLYFAFLFTGWLSPYIGAGDFTADLADYRSGLFLGTLIAGLFHLMYARREAKEAAQASEKRLRKAENERLQAQIASLTAQMNPHLLFNSLNTVASLISSDPTKAEATIVHLSELYRGVLDSSKKMVHSLATELRICESYLSVERARFGERLRVRFDIDPSIDEDRIMVPALCLQPLVENAVKHGISSRESGGEITVVAARAGELLNLRVEDDGVGFGASRSKSGSGTAVANCRSRIDLHFPHRGAFDILPRDGGGTVVAMKFPISESI